MRAVIDGRPLQPGFKAHRERGIGRYSKNLIAAMLELADAPRLELLVQANLPDPGWFQDLPRLRAGYAPAALPVGKRLISHHLLARSPLAPAWRRGDVVHFLSHLDAPARLGPASVITVHDLIAQRLAALYQGGKSGPRFRLERWLETRCLFSAAAIIVPSRQTRADLEELYGIDPDRVRVIPEAADPGLKPVTDPEARRAVLGRHRLDIARPFFLYLGGIDQRKDLDGLLRACAALRERGLDFTLALAGKIDGDRLYPALKARVTELGLEDTVRELGFVPDADLPALFSACTAFVFPSLYEGFGLPPLEAMACGAPVVAARASAVPEVVGEAGLLVEPGRVEALAEAMAAVAGSAGLAAGLREKGLKQAAGFSWPRAAEATLALYRELAA